MESTLAIIIQLISGAVGGNAAGALMKRLSLGTLLNSLVGILGGGIGGQLLGFLGIGTVSGGPGVESIWGSILGGAVGGGALLAIISIIKQAFGK